jgi:hypothetical protein
MELDLNDLCRAAGVCGIEVLCRLVSGRATRRQGASFLSDRRTRKPRSRAATREAPWAFSDRRLSILWLTRRWPVQWLSGSALLRGSFPGDLIRLWHDEFYAATVFQSQVDTRRMRLGA